MRTDLGVTKDFPLIFETSVFNHCVGIGRQDRHSLSAPAGREKHHLHPADHNPNETCHIVLIV